LSEWQALGGGFLRRSRIALAFAADIVTLAGANLVGLDSLIEFEIAVKSRSLAPV
jgi:hypothetical protein